MKTIRLEFDSHETTNSLLDFEPNDASPHRVWREEAHQQEAHQHRQDDKLLRQTSGAPYKFSDIPPPVVSSLPADLKKKLKVNEPVQTDTFRSGS